MAYLFEKIYDNLTLVHGNNCLRSILKRRLVKENLNVIQNTSPKRLMSHLLHQMIYNRTNLGGHSIQIMIITNQATTTPDRKPQGV